MTTKERASGLTYQDLSPLFVYDPETGTIFNRVRRSSRAQRGDRAGCAGPLGYYQIHVRGHVFYSHRLAWLLHEGQWPSGEVDHINGDRGDNRLFNLRVVTARQNQQNRSIHRGGKLPGCCLRKDVKRSKPWMSYIRIDGVLHFLGYFTTEEEAHVAYVKAIQELGDRELEAL